MKNLRFIDIFVFSAVIILLLFFKINIFKFAIFVTIAGVCTILVHSWYKKHQVKKAHQFIDDYQFQEKVLSKYNEIYPEQDSTQELKNYFKQMILHSYYSKEENPDPNKLSEPAQKLWHLFFASSRSYRIFCMEVFNEMVEPVEIKEEKSIDKLSIYDF